MPFASNIHTHTTFGDGLNTAEEMVLAALEKGFVSLGFSEHAPAPYDPDCAIPPENVAAYFSEIARLKEACADRLEIYQGMESDALCPFDKARLDYSIGSVHYLPDPETGEYYCVDYLPEIFGKAVERIGGGDVREVLRRYYGLVEEMLETYRPDILGHMDLPVKLNKNGRFFDEDSRWYKKLVESAAEKAAASGCIVEVNTGGIARGYRSEPYPSVYILSILRDLKVPVTITSDAHESACLDYHFDETIALLRDLGFRSIKRLHGGHFAYVELDSLLK